MIGRSNIRQEIIKPNIKKKKKKLKNLGTSLKYKTLQGANLVNSMYNAIPMEVALKKGGKIRRKKGGKI